VRPPAEASRAATLALSCLVALAVGAPWAFGAVLPAARLALVLLALAVVALGLLAGAARGNLALPAVAAWPVAGFLALALAQLVPLPEPLHRLLAPGSHAVWHPRDPAVAGLLGAGARPLSVDPDTTLEALALCGGLALLALLAAPALTRERLAVRAVAAVALSGFALSAYAILARARFGALLYGRIPVPTVAPFGPFVSKNHFAGYVELAKLQGIGCKLGQGYLFAPPRASDSVPPLFRGPDPEQQGALRPRSAGGETGDLQQASDAERVVMGAVADRIAIRVGRAGAVSVPMAGEHDGFVGPPRAGQAGDDVAAFDMLDDGGQVG